MKVFLIGLGRAGCRIAHLFFSSKEVSVDGVLIDTDKADLGYLKYKYRIIAGEGILGGEGTQKDIDLGREVIHADKFSIVEKITRVKEDVDCFFVISALGGGTGGACGILLEELRKNVIEPIYHIGVLPSQEDLSTITINASKGLKDVVKHCDAFFPVDMDLLKVTTHLKGNYSSLNNQIFKYLHPLFHIGDFRGRGDIGENTVDFSDFTQTIRGLSILGIHRQNLVEESSTNKPEAVIALTQKAVKETTMPVELLDVQKALVVVLGDRKHIDFLGSIPARLWVEKHIGSTEVRGGDMPLSTEGVVEVLVVLSNIKRSAEIAELYQKGAMLIKSETLGESFSGLVDRIGSMKNKLSDLEKELDETYKRLRELVRE